MKDKPKQKIQEQTIEQLISDLRSEVPNLSFKSKKIKQSDKKPEETTEVRLDQKVIF